MNWDAIGAISEGVGAIAVVITLIYLARQLRDHSKTLKLQSLDSTFREWNEQLREVQSDPQLSIAFRKAQKGESLNDDETHRLTYFFRRIFNSFAKMQFLSSVDAADEFNHQSIYRTLPYLLGMPFFREWWPAHKDRYDDSFQAYIEKELKNTPNKAMEADT